MTIGDDSERLGSDFFQITLPLRAFRQVIACDSVAMYTRSLSQAGDAAFREPTRRCQRTRPVFALIAKASPVFSTRYSQPLASTGWNSISEPRPKCHSWR